MMRFSFLKIVKYLLTALGLVAWSSLVAAELATQNDCRPLKPATRHYDKSLVYSNAILWKVSKDGSEPSYIFGTMHVSDPRVTKLPDKVSEKLNKAETFVMEALPEPEEAIKFSQMMFYNNGTTLKEYIDEALFNHMVDILAQYQLPPEAVPYIKPWAAFLIMNYPAENGTPLDLQLLNTAKQNGTEVKGLETLTEQGNIFSSLDFKTQMQLLLDTVCNYDSMENDYEAMKTYYLKRDLQGLVSYSNKYSFSEEKIYKDLFKKLLQDRNIKMADRMQDTLKKGDAFIAIGAMHLPGDDGVLALLAKKGYRITSVY